MCRLKHGGASATLFLRGKTLYLSNLYSREESKGHATILLAYVTWVCKALGKSCELDVSSSGRRSQEELIRWYKHRGFDCLVTASYFIVNGKLYIRCQLAHHPPTKGLLR